MTSRRVKNLSLNSRNLNTLCALSLPRAYLVDRAVSLEAVRETY